MAVHHWTPFNDLSLEQAYLPGYRDALAGQRTRPKSPEAAAFLKRKGCKVIAEPTPKAIKIYNLTRKPKVGLFHVTCSSSSGRELLISG